MSRQLPAHASLEYLKKQAKRRLADLQRQEPGSQLADVQHAIAREYGFVNWASLKSHAESRPAASPLAGSWRLERAEPPDGAAPSTIEFGIDGDLVTITDVRLDAPGRVERTATTLTADGREHPAAHGYVVTATWMGSTRLEATARKDGAIVGRVVYQVSGDERTLTVDSESLAHVGYPENLRRATFRRASAATDQSGWSGPSDHASGGLDPSKRDSSQV